MRQGHQNRRGRGRSSSSNGSSSNRKGQNPLTRSFESNGPDVKIRGTPAHIAEKYISLARDAKSSGDEVLAENYLQHAEHYNRIIMAFREQQVGQGGEQAGGGAGQRFRVPQLQDGIDDDDFSGDEGDDFGGDQQPVMRSNEPQPMVAQPQPFESGDRGERGDGREPQRHDRPERQQGGGHRYEDRQRRNQDNFRNRDRDRDREPRQGDYARQPGPDRPAERSFDRPTEPQGFVPERAGHPVQPAAAAVEPGFEPVNGQRPLSEGGTPRGERPERVEGSGPRRRERFQQQPHHEQPEFLRRPVRRPRRDPVAGEEGGDGEANGAAPHVPPVRDDGGPVE